MSRNIVGQRIVGLKPYKDDRFLDYKNAERTILVLENGNEIYTTVMFGLLK